MAASIAQSSGHLLATTLAGSWRSSPPALDCSATELEEVAPLVLNSGAAALCWRRVRDSGLRDGPAAHEFHQAYRQNFLQAAVRERTIGKVFGLLRAAGVEPILVKGWSAARLYPERGLRPYGDIDLCVRPDQFEAAETALWEALAYGRYEVDLHSGFDSLGGSGVDAIYARSRLLKLGATDVRVLGREDELRVLSIHMLREGAWRPLWMCDVAAAVEAAGDDFDWDRCLTENRRQAEWVNCAIRAAHQLLGADIGDTPAARTNKPLPRWLVPTILKEWASRRPSMQERHRAPMASYLRKPAGILKGLRHRWPNPIEATVCLRGSFNELPRLPFQFGNCLMRAVKFAAHLPGSLRQL